MKRILLIGPLPPPFGGVSIHLERLSKLIENDFDIDFIDESRLIKNNFFNIRSMKLVQYFRKIKKSDLLFVHSGINVLRIFHLIIGFVISKKIILSIHSYPYSKKLLFRYLDGLFFRLANFIIIVNPEILGRVKLPIEKSIVNHAFLPPVMENEPHLPASLTDWISNRKNIGRLIVCANASQLVLFNNQDLYGLDMCIDAATILIKKGHPISFIFIVSSLDKGEDLFLHYQSAIKKSDLQENFLLLNENLSFVRLSKHADIILRPTNTDGDALTVREAIYLGKPIIASDIVNRPLGTILFRTRDINDLVIRLIETINLSKAPISSLSNKNDEEYRMFYIDLINKTLKQSNN